MGVTDLDGHRAPTDGEARVVGQTVPPFPGQRLHPELVGQDNVMLAAIRSATWSRSSSTLIIMPVRVERQGIATAKERAGRSLHVGHERSSISGGRSEMFTIAMIGDPHAMASA